MSAVEEVIRKRFAGAEVDGFLCVLDIHSDKEVAVKADALVVSASVFKVPVLLELLLQASRGLHDLNEMTTRPRNDPRVLGSSGLTAVKGPLHMTLADAAALMITLSDAGCTDLVTDRVGIAAVNATMRALGFTDTVIMEDHRSMLDAATNDLGVRGLEEYVQGTLDVAGLQALRTLDALNTNHTTACESAAFLKMIWRDEAATPEICQEMRRILGLQAYSPRLRGGFPGSVKVSGKTGTLPTIRNEVGVVEYPEGGSYAIAIFTRSHSMDSVRPEVDRCMQEVAALAVSWLRGDH